MAKHGIYAYSVMEEVSRGSVPQARTYSEDLSKKPERINLYIEKPYGTPAVKMDDRRCPVCGGYVFTEINGADKVVCHNCGKVHLKKEWLNFEREELSPEEKHARHIYDELLHGGDLREDKVENVLNFKDRNGMSLGTLPIPYAAWMVMHFKWVRICRMRKNSPESVKEEM